MNKNINKLAQELTTTRTPEKVLACLMLECEKIQFSSQYNVKEFLIPLIQHLTLSLIKDDMTIYKSLIGEAIKHRDLIKNTCLEAAMQDQELENLESDPEMAN